MESVIHPQFCIPLGPQFDEHGSDASRQRARSPSVRLLLVFFVPSFVVVVGDDDNGGAAVDWRATALKILEGLKITAVPCALDGVAPSPVHRTVPANRDSPLPLLSDDDNDNDDDVGNAQTLGLLYSQSSLHRIAMWGPLPGAPLGRNVSCVGKWR